MQENSSYNIPSEVCSKINKWLLKFPKGENKPAIIFALHQIQKESKYICFAYVRNCFSLALFD